MPSLSRRFFPSRGLTLPSLWLASATVALGLAGLPGAAAENAATAPPETEAPESPARLAKPAKRKGKSGDPPRKPGHEVRGFREPPVHGHVVKGILA